MASTSNVSKEEDSNDDEGRCGFGGWSPDWLQTMSSKKVFIIAYGLLGLNEIAVAAYFSGIISTVEKRFKLPSKITGVIASSYDVGATLAIVAIAYYGGTGHKTRWIGICSVVAGFACYGYYLPHLIYGSGQTRISHEANNSIRELCGYIKDENDVENCSLNIEGHVATIVFISASILMGIGCCSYYTLGAAYLDDNVLKNKFPFLISLVSLTRSFGATFGFWVSSLAVSYYIDSKVVPTFTKDDPRWIGAWYKGWIPFGTFEIVLALAFMLFPKTLKREAERKKKKPKLGQINESERSIKGFMKTIKRLLTNKIYMLNTFSTTFFIFGGMGWWTFLPKYIETQFRVSASKSNFILGTTGLVFSGLGMMTSGAIVSRYKPRPRFLTSWNVFTEIVDILCIFCMAYLGCFKEDLHGTYKENGEMELVQQCNSYCNCSAIEYSPVCSYDQTATFYSPCHAGCTTFSMINETKVFANCSCIGGIGTATDGACPVDCSFDFHIFIALNCLSAFLSSTGQAGNVIVQYRSVAPEDKSMSIAFTELIFAVLAFIPTPIIYGMLLDTTCLVWGDICGERGNCWMYHGKNLRHLLCITSIIFILIGTILDIGVVYYVGSLEMYDEPVVDESDKRKSIELENEIPFIDQ